MSPILILLLMVGLLFIGTVAIGAAIFFFQRYHNPEPSLLQRRLIEIRDRQATQDKMEADEAARKMARLYKETNYHNNEMGQRLEGLQLFRTLKIRMEQAGIKTPPDQFFLMGMVAPVFLLPIVGIGVGFFPLVLAGPAVAFGSYGYVLVKRGGRLGKFVAQMPDALSMITSALRAGHSFQSALSVVATEMGEPISYEFSGLVRDINLGIPVKDALNRLVGRLDGLPDLRMFSTAVLIQREAGGNLAEVLEKLGYTIRERFKLKGQIAALTGQSRLTGYVLGAAPAVLLTFLSIFMYGYVKPLWETELGHIALGIICIMQGIGFFVMKKIIEIRV